MSALSTKTPSRKAAHLEATKRARHAQKQRQKAAQQAAINPSSNKNEAQRQRLIERLLIVGMIDTITARRELDILCPAARVLELRKRGHLIDTVKIQRQTDCGKLHRVGLYILRGEVQP